MTFHHLTRFAALICSLLGLCLASVTASDDLRLSNGVSVATFSSTSGSLTSFQLLSAFPSPIPFLVESTSVTLNSTLVLTCTALISTLSSPTSVTFSYLCPPSLPFQLTSIYTLQPTWTFLQKQTHLFNLSTQAGAAYEVTAVQQTLSFDPTVFTETGTFHNNVWQPSKDHALFLRTAVTAGAPGLFAAFQSPFAVFTGNAGNCCATAEAAGPLVFNATYPVGLPVVNSYGESFSTDGFIIGGYVLSPYWHLNPPPALAPSTPSSPRYDRGYSLNYAEREAFTGCVEKFWLGPPRTTSVRMAVGWDSNDFQLDISTPHGVDGYHRILDRCAELGLTHLIFAPQNSAVSSRFNATDGWGWEEALWLTLGEHLRAGLWVAGRDPIPPTIQSMIDYAASRGVLLMAYVYPPLGFRAAGDSAWLYGGDCCASLAEPTFQRYLASTMIAFAKQTGIGGFSFDYNGYGDSRHTTYAQWKGWHWVLHQLKEAFPDIVMDHRQIAHAEGPWSWLTGSYAEPLQGDENPESYGVLLPSLHTDHTTANTMRSEAANYRIYQLAPYALLPGFIGHQTERSFPNGSLAWTDNFIRDFDVLGFPYSLLSTIAAGGLNLIHTMLPARDESEFALLPTSLVLFWKQWLDWPTQHRAELDRAIPIRGPALDEVDGWVTMESSGWYGHVFLFNPNYPLKVMNLVLTDALLLQPPPVGAVGVWLLSEVYPRPATLRSFQWGDSLDLTLDGDSATVYELRWVEWKTLPRDSVVLIGVGGQTEVVGGEVLRISGVMGEAGTSSGDISVHFPTAVLAHSIRSVLINGANVSFIPTGNAVVVQQPLSFPGLRLPRSAQLGQVPRDFQGGNYSVTLTVSDELLEQLRMRQVGYPIEWTDEELGVGWLAPHRLLLFLSIISPQDTWNVSVQLNGVPVRVQKAYTSRRPVPSCFQGFFLDLTQAAIKANVDYQLHFVLPTLSAGQFKGVFLENIEPIMVGPTMPAGMDEGNGEESARGLHAMQE